MNTVDFSQRLLSSPEIHFRAVVFGSSYLDYATPFTLVDMQSIDQFWHQC